jgi:hypothetical protein
MRLFGSSGESNPDERFPPRLVGVSCRAPGDETEEARPTDDNSATALMRGSGERILVVVESFLERADGEVGKADDGHFLLVFARKSDGLWRAMMSNYAREI